MNHFGNLFQGMVQKMSARDQLAEQARAYNYYLAIFKALELCLYRAMGVRGRVVNAPTPGKAVIIPLTHVEQIGGEKIYDCGGCGEPIGRGKDYSTVAIICSQSQCGKINEYDV